MVIDIFCIFADRMTYSCIPRRVRKAAIFVIALTLCAIVLTQLSRKSSVKPLHESSRSLLTGNKSDGKFLVDTPFCRIPDVDPYDSTIKDIVHKTGKRTCPQDVALTYQTGRQLRINWSLGNNFKDTKIKYCVYTPLYRPNYTPTHSNYWTYLATSEPFSSPVEIKHEFVKVNCYDVDKRMVYTNFHAFIQRNTSLDAILHERLIKHAVKDKITEQLNVMVLGMDSVSRLSFKRQMVKTKNFLENTLGAYDMSGYNKVADNTFINIVPMTLGKYVSEMPWDESMQDETFDKFKFVWNNYSQNGYRTFYAEDAPDIAIFDFLKAGFKTPPTDHFNRHMCSAMELKDNLWSNAHHCFQNRLETDIVLNYLRDFVDTYKADPHFAFTFITRLSHDDVNSAGAADEPYYTFFKSLHNKDLLRNTIVFFYSDHGMRFGKIRETFIGKLEERLPFMYVIVPKWLRVHHPFVDRNMKINQHRLTTPFDVYETMKDILSFNGEEKPVDGNTRGVSWFREVPQSRSCDQAGILPHWCACLQHKTISLHDEIVSQASAALLAKIQTELSNYKKICHDLSLKRTHEATRLVEPDIRAVNDKQSLKTVLIKKVFGDNTKRLEDIQVVIETVPGNALFEATVRLDTITEQFTVLGDISRINMYGHQSDCIDVFKLKKYCQCKDFQT